MRGFVAATFLAVVLFAAGCGGGGGGGGSSTQSSGEATKSAEQVVKDAQKAAESASSVHVAGVIAQSGKQAALDLTLVRDKGASGSVTFQGKKFQLIVIGSTAYLKAGASFWKHYPGPSGVAQVLQNKWLKFDAKNSQFGGLTNLTNEGRFFNLLNSHGTLENQGETTYKGQSVVAIHDATKNATLYVAASGTPYPAAIVKTNDPTAGTVTFDQWNQTATLTAPKGALDFSQLGG
jgi:hypothetical protein